MHRYRLTFANGQTAEVSAGDFKNAQRAVRNDPLINNPTEIVKGERLSRRGQWVELQLAGGRDGH